MYPTYPKQCVDLFLKKSWVRFFLTKNQKIRLARAFDSLILWGALNHAGVMRDCGTKQGLVEEFDKRRESVLLGRI